MRRRSASRACTTRRGRTPTRRRRRRRSCAAIEIYHVKSNGWNDIGYNFLVDRYGTVYEGRYGGIDRNVIGAYARGFNTGSIGVAVIGTFSTAAIPAAAETSLEKLLAWRLDLAHVDPVSTLTFVSGGSERYRAGVPVVLRAVSGHRDTGLTTCPGDLLYAKLGTIAAKTQAIGLPKLYEPKVTGGLGGPVRFQARVSSALAWKVTVTDALGQQLAAGTGKGPTVDYTWDASLVTATGATWRIEVAGATPVSGTFGKAASSSPARSRSPVSPPTRPRSARTATARPTRPRSPTRRMPCATVTVDAARLRRRPARDDRAPGRLAAGEHSFTFDGLGQPDGIYTIVVTAIDAAGVSVSQPADDRDHANARPRRRSHPPLLTPNGDGSGDPLTVDFQLAAPATVRLRVLRDGKWVATPFTGPLPAGPQSLGWNGAKRLGRTFDGRYTAVIDATDAVGTATVSLPFLLDAHPPVVKLVARPAPALALGGGDRDGPRQRVAAAPAGARDPATSPSPASARSSRSWSSRVTRRATRRSSASPDRSSRPTAAPVDSPGATLSRSRRRIGAACGQSPSFRTTD